MNTNSAVTGSFFDNKFWRQQFRGGQPIAKPDAADNCRLYVTTKRAMNFQDDIPSTLIDNFKDNQVLVYDLTSMKDATEKFFHPELVGEPLRLKLNFTFPLEHGIELIVKGERMSLVAIDTFAVVGNSI